MLPPYHAMPCPHDQLQGALLRTAGIADSRTVAGSRSQVQRMLHSEHRKLRDTLWELLAQHAPSARR
jgi:hypothetical protein